MNKCPVCEGPVIYEGLCNACQEQKSRMEEIARQKKRDAAFGSPWHVIGERNGR